MLHRSRDLGFLGPGPVERHLDHARVFVTALGTSRRAIDLGSGGGLPGLAVAWWVSDLELMLLDASEKRCRFLQEAIEELGLTDRLTVRCGRAEELARETDLRQSVPTVMARSFGAPAVTAECAVGFLNRPGASVLVSEPPEASAEAVPPATGTTQDPGSDPIGAENERWPAAGLNLLGLERSGIVSGDGASVVVLTLSRPLDDRYPRRNGIPSKRPLF